MTTQILTDDEIIDLVTDSNPIGTDGEKNAIFLSKVSGAFLQKGFSFNELNIVFAVGFLCGVRKLEEILNKPKN